jgi:virulence factor
MIKVTNLLDVIKKYRKEQYLEQALFVTKKQYAFVGIGMHSLSNLYPIIRHFNIKLKYICTKKTKKTKELERLFPDSIFTHDPTQISNDKEVEGVFICASPPAHYELLSVFLNANKKVFVEKPPCQTLDELKKLITLHPSASCKIGLQRRYWPGNKYFLSKCKKAVSYTYHFHLGNYISGNPYTELFIHPLDFCGYIFGNYSICSFTQKKGSKGILIQMHVEHKGGISGLIELSTSHSWNSPLENLLINCEEELYTIKYPTLVNAQKKPSRFLNIPTERLTHQPVVTKEYFSSNNLIIPSLDLNTLVLQGFYEEIKSFVLITENDLTENDLPSLINIYEVLERIENS